MTLRNRILLLVAILLVVAVLVTGLLAVFLSAGRPEGDMTARVLATLVVLAGLLLAGGLASIRLARRVTDPLQKISAAAAAVEKGEYRPGALAEVIGRKDEVGQLGRVFDRMGAEVSARDRRLKLLRRVIPVGVGLSSEKDFNRLLEAIVIESQDLTNADGGTLYILEDQALKFMIVRNERLNFAMGGTTGQPIPFAPLPLQDRETGLPNHRNVATHCALLHEQVNIPDAYHADGFDFTGTREFDRQTGYHSQSFLNIPLESDDHQVIGVLQLINARDPETGRVTSFVADEVFETLILLATTALIAYLRLEQLRREIDKLNIQIDHTKRSRQVTEITETEYFRTLQGKVRQIRSKKKGQS